MLAGLACECIIVADLVTQSSVIGTGLGSCFLQLSALLEAARLKIIVRVTLLCTYVDRGMHVCGGELLLSVAEARRRLSRLSHMAS